MPERCPGVLLLCLSLSWSLGGAIEAPEIAWVRGYSNGDLCEAHPHAAVETSDGNFVLVGDTVCYDGDDFTTDHGREMFVVAADKNGKELWSEKHGVIGYTYGKNVLDLEDGTVLVCGGLSVADKNAPTVNGEQYTEVRSIFRLDVQSGKKLNTWSGENAKAAEGRRDGSMGLALISADPISNITTVALTGYLGGEPAIDGGDDYQYDEPMFLIPGGNAFVEVLQYSSYDKTAQPKTVWTTVLPDSAPGAAGGFNQSEGMRIIYDEANSQLIVAATAIPSEGGNLQMSAAALRVSDGEVLWRNAYPASNATAMSGDDGTMSHPYALTLARGSAGGYAIAGHAYSEGFVGGLPVGRLLRIDSKGQKVFDARFRPSDAAMDKNVECYGVDTTPDEGFIVTCGFGCMECMPSDTPAERTWQVLTHRTDAAGNMLWEKLYTNTTNLQNNAGENILTTKDGRYATLVDTQTWGSHSTGGNFGLMMLEADIA